VDVDTDGVSQNVRTFYERHPYPPPVANLDKYRGLSQDRQGRRADFHLIWPAQRYREDHAILIAGCGTSQAAKHALRWPSARITGVDVSAASVRHTEVLKQKYQLHNLEVRQLPIERVGELASTFDHVVCTGVLHHLSDPGPALSALRDVLRPAGAINIMVYAPYGRTGIYMLQEFCRRVGIQATDEGIRELVAALALLPNGHPLATLLREAPDFRDEAALADALLHPQDRAYSVPQLFELLESGRLTFGRWIRQAPYDPNCGIMARLPRATATAGLSVVDRCAAVELFRGTMLRHSVIAYRDDDREASRQPSFAGDAWPRYVPIRLAETICLEERAPPGAAAVLINRTHAHSDIYLPIDAREKRMFDTIDGKRTIAELARSVVTSPGSAGHLDVARSFFARLYRYDQVVFDASE
jgi:SAM-dependent methyltransferase